MIKKRVKKIGELMFLITIRQSWKLICNLYNIIREPFLALKKLIIKDKDKSQIFLVGLMAIMPAIFYISARIVWDNYNYGYIPASVGKIFLIIFVIEIMILGYLGFWIWKIFRK
ncbi:MAG: hypothetical protein PHH12_02270 [Candidatus Shapirobacteria bacterium]|jgi:hypothetical protein|nr:hypothetical protein [Candidatus Shapirobacteria bacterium]